MLSFCIFLLPVLAQAADYNVNCSNPKAPLKSITQALNIISVATKQGPNTIHVSGTCNESVTINGFDNLSLLANAGASINDPTPSIPDDNDVVDIINSQRITVAGFTVNGGSSGIACLQYSICFLNSNTVQGASNAGVTIGHGASADLNDDTIQSGGDTGLWVLNGSSAVVKGGTIQGNPGEGALAQNHSMLQLVNDGTAPAAVQNNGSDGSVPFLVEG